MHGATEWFCCATTIGAAKSIRFENKKHTMSNLKIVLKSVKNKKKSQITGQPKVLELPAGSGCSRLLASLPQ
jgi:hypothetical protein